MPLEHDFPNAAAFLVALRDFYATEALRGLMRDNSFEPGSMAEVGDLAYSAADSMMAARGKQ